MRLRVDRAHLRTALFATAFVLALPYSIQASSQTVTQINLVTDNQDFLTSQGFSAAANVDPNLINPWGMSFSTTSPFWISDQGTGVSTLYNANGVPQSLIVTIPGSATGPSGPTGQVFNGTSISN